jgi:hypothetical protein
MSYASLIPDRTETGDFDMNRIAQVAALGAWRVTQGIYRFDETVLDALWTTPVNGEIPSAVLCALPEWCVYIETPGRLFARAPINGFFCFLQFEDDDQQTDLIILLDLASSADFLPSFPIRLGKDLLSAAADSQKSLEEALRLDPTLNIFREALDVSAQDIVATCSPLISTVLYLCSTNAEIPGRDTRLPQPVNTKHGQRLFPTDRSHVWEVGFRIGASIRRSVEAGHGATSKGAHAGPRPHIRRAHWHSFWTGPRAGSPGHGPEQKLVLHWLPPIPVAVTDKAAIVPTLHTVHSL